MTDPTPNFPGNSKSPKKTERKQLTRVTTSDPVQRKTPLGKKIASTFAGDDAKSVGIYILFDVVIPAVKAMMSDAASQGIDRLLFGDVRNRNRGGSRTDYNKIYNGGTTVRYGRSPEETPRRAMSQRGRATHDFDEIVLESRGEAEEVLDILQSSIDQYDTATVSDLYALVGITGSFTDDKWGWTNLIDASVSHVREGYLLNLPKPQPLD